MEDNSFNAQCDDTAKEFNLRIPCRLMARVETYASANKTTITSVVIEALDTFLRGRPNG